MAGGYIEVGEEKKFKNPLNLATADGRNFVIVNEKGRLYALDGNCTHKGGPLWEGSLENGVITCPWHGGKFDCKSGKVCSPPPQESLKKYEVKVENGKVFIKI